MSSVTCTPEKSSGRWLLSSMISGPLTPKCVKSISPSSSKIFFLPTRALTRTFLSESPCRSVGHFSSIVSPTSEARSGVTVCPLSRAKR